VKRERVVEIPLARRKKEVSEASKGWIELEGNTKEKNNEINWSSRKRKRDWLEGGEEDVEVEESDNNNNNNN
jgi:hypothetical protein